jgi:phosphatidylglycerol:prolipoprotein diacylglycerol transferase
VKPPLDPILIRITPTFGIHWYGILIVSGIMLGAVYAAWRARRDGENPDHVWNALILAIILGIVGARLYHVFSEPEGGMVGWSYYREHPIEILYIWQGGLGIYGAIVGGLVGVTVYAWRSNLRPLQWLDYGAPGLAIGQAIGRWGNFINQELYGPPTTLPWGLVIAPEHRISQYADLATYPPETLFHPTFLYESLLALLLFLTLAFIHDRRKDRLLPGDILLGYLIGYPVVRFFVEFFRPDAWMIGKIAAAQLFAIIIALAATAITVVRHVLVRPSPSGPLAGEVLPPAGEQDEGPALDSLPDTRPEDESA